ncbi:hypothetical protein PG994_000625 [Apiospora phragmitis]|uniref:Uncharacterized protein n=1 Tax=Apiospora phragmitis TaxID=2905665 RepID=A0ABR1X6T1_9PEZI
MQLPKILNLSALCLPAVFSAPVEGRTATPSLQPRLLIETLVPGKDIDQKRGTNGLYNYIVVDAAELAKPEEKSGVNDLYSNIAADAAGSTTPSE